MENYRIEKVTNNTLCVLVFLSDLCLYSVHRAQSFRSFDRAVLIILWLQFGPSLVTGVPPSDCSTLCRRRVISGFLSGPKTAARGNALV